MILRPLVFVLLAAASSVATAAVAHAQTERDVSIDFEVGDFDPERGDWSITAVVVSGDLEQDEIFVVELYDEGGEVIWAGEGVYEPPSTTVVVGEFVAVGEVEEAAIGQRLPEEEEPTPTATTVAPTVAPDEAEQDVATSLPATTLPPPDLPPATSPPPDVEGDVTTQEGELLPQQGSGVGGAGQLALSMVVAVVFVAILFRSPLPSATTTRWRK